MHILFHKIRSLKERKVMFLRNFLAICTLSSALSYPAFATSINSIYTDLSSDRCITIEVNKETGDSVQKCPGVAGYSLLVNITDGRQYVTVLKPDGQKHSLKYSQTFSVRASNKLGKKAEWRVERREGAIAPVALIVRTTNAFGSYNSPRNKTTSYLAVAKIAGDDICVTKIVKGGAKANQEARRAADVSPKKLCI